MTARTIEQRLQEMEDREAIRQTMAGYGYAMDGCNAPAVGAFAGRPAVEAITRRPTHLELVPGGCAHIATSPFIVIDGDVATSPFIVIDGDRAIATCHTMVARHGDDGFFIGRLSASRMQLARQADSGWQIVHRQNYMLDGSPEGPAMLARLNEGPAA